MSNCCLTEYAGNIKDFDVAQYTISNYEVAAKIESVIKYLVLVCGRYA